MRGYARDVALAATAIAIWEFFRYIEWVPW